MAKYQKYTEYKDSAIKEIGVIPKHWDISKVKFLAKCLDGHRIPLNGTERGERSGTVPYWGANKIVDYVNDWIFDEELVLLGEDGAPFFDTTKDVAFAINGKIWPNNHVHVLRPNRLKVGIKYLTYSLNCTDYSLYISGSTRDKLNQSDMDNILIRMPSLIEQSQIANFLDHETAKIDSLIAKQEKLIELLKEKRQAVISHAVTKGLNPDVTMKDSGVEWLGQVPEHWAVAKLAYRYEVLLGKMLDESKITGNYLGKYLRNTDVQWGRVNSENLPEMDFRPHEIERYSVQQGDLLVCEGGEIGRCAIWESEDTCFYQKALHRLRAYSSQDSHKFMFYVLFDSVHRERFISGAGKATIAHLPAETFKQYRFAFPPKNEQVQIVEYLDTMSKAFDEIETKALAQIKLLQERRTALISSAVTGKIDVRNWQHPNEAKTGLSA